jgi:NAD(P)-dependent dehydrogenase (short-subunit alcohol dehydrogenase family)
MMHHKVVLVTGANAGMGKAIATDLARQGANVVMVARDARKGEEARREIAHVTGSRSIDLLIADLSSQEAIRRLVEEFRQRYAHLHVLVNNAGAHIQKRQLSADGIELNLAINHLSAFLLTNLLLDTLRASAPARIVNVASASMTKTIALDDLQSAHSFAPFAVYGQAKLAMVLCTYALARRLAGTGVTVNALHPGITGTKIADDVAPPLVRPFMGLIKRFLRSPEQGARTALYLATSPAVEGVSGRYFSKGKEARSVPISYDEALQERMWAISMELTGLMAGHGDVEQSQAPGSTMGERGTAPGANWRQATPDTQ